MRAFACPNCQRLNHFEVRVCPGCQATLGYDPQIDAFRFLADDNTQWRDARGNTANVVTCQNNNDHQICNWLTRADDIEPLCRACRHNHMIPDLTVEGVPERWAKVEAAKRRLFHTLLKLQLPLETKAQERPGVQGLAFDFLYDPAAEARGHAEVLTGHDEGLITLNLIEADDAERERIRHQMGEPYRTLLGHFRHEVGHHYWSRLIEPDPYETQACRNVFGDERIDYAAALKNHYSDSPDHVWTEDYVSAYATSHPWEDFAETFAHYLHIVDLLATARGFDLSLTAFPQEGADGEVDLAFNPYTAATADLISDMVPLSFAMNALNRSMGQPDLYPFNLTDPVIAKLDYINRLVARARVSGFAPA